jgi:DNA gyrase/topoisomerase IV subunit B
MPKRDSYLEGINKRGRQYDADSIDVNLGLDVVRKTPQIYLGNPDSDGVLHCVQEPIDNVFDECLQPEVKNKFVGVVVDRDGFIWVYDAARGIPVETHKVTKISTLTTIMTTLSSGGKMRTGKGASYEKTGGIHGMGVSITNAMSASMEVWTYRKKWYYQKFAKGKPITKVEQRKPPRIPDAPRKLAERDCGTIIKFIPDFSVFDRGAKLRVKHLQRRLELSAYLHPKVKVYYSSDGERQVFHQPNGLHAYLENLLDKNKAEAVGKVFEFSSGDINIAMVWSNIIDELNTSYVNGINTTEGGTHISGLNKILGEVLLPFKPKRAEYRTEDLREGLICIMNLRIDNPRFGGQTKAKLVTPEAADLVAEKLREPLKKFFAANRNYARSIIDRAVDVRKALQELTISKKAASNLRTMKKGKLMLPAKLKASLTKDPSKRELFLVEGDSAGGTAADARDKQYQEVLPLFGKMLNVYRATSDKIFGNQPILDIMQAIGFDPNKKDPFDKLRVDKVMLLADSDSDGDHINLLMSTAIYKLLQPLIDRGKVYVVDPALFMTQIGNKRYFGESRKDLLRQLPERSRKAVNVTRIKGWGEVNPAELEQVAFNPKTRKLTRLIAPRRGTSDIKQFLSVVGSETDFRKELLGLTAAH